MAGLVSEQDLLNEDGAVNDRIMCACKGEEVVFFQASQWFIL